MHDGTPAPRLPSFREPTTAEDWDRLHAQTRRIRAGQTALTEAEYCSSLAEYDPTALLTSYAARRLMRFADCDRHDLKQEIYLCGMEQRTFYDDAVRFDEWMAIIGLVHLRARLGERMRLHACDSSYQQATADWGSDAAPRFRRAAPRRKQLLVLLGRAQLDARAPHARS
jgi:hypothetical protein